MTTLPFLLRGHLHADFFHHNSFVFSVWFHHSCLQTLNKTVLLLVFDVCINGTILCARTWPWVCGTHPRTLLACIERCIVFHGLNNRVISCSVADGCLACIKVVVITNSAAMNVLVLLAAHANKIY